MPIVSTWAGVSASGCRPTGGTKSAGGDEDAVSVDLAIDRRPGHAERLGRLGLVAARVQQALHDRVALQGLQRAQPPAADRPALRRQVAWLDGADPLAGH